jgi:anti-sigma B factor antagonist
VDNWRGPDRVCSIDLTEVEWRGSWELGMTALDADLDVAGEMTVVRLAGEIDIAAAPDVLALATVALTRPELRTLVLDMGDVTFLDSTGIGALVQVHRLCRDQPAELQLRGLQPRVRQVFDVTALSEHFGLTEHDISDGAQSG